jgi:hypothetical protein
MPKKIKPKDQSWILAKAQYELLKRNKEKYDEFLKRSDVQNVLAFSEEQNFTQQMIDGWLARIATGCFPVLAIKNDYPCKIAWAMASAKADRDKSLPGDPIKDMDQLSDLYLIELIKNAENIVRHYLGERPLEHLLVSIDLTRSTEAILAEVKQFVTILKKGMKEGRLKWLPIIEDLLTVWDLWDEAGQPARQSFPEIAKKLDIPESTVKARWYRAYELIYEKPYENDPVKRREDRENKAIKELCLNCKNPVCGEQHGAEWIGCPDYIKMVGGDTFREKTFDNFDKINDMHQKDDFLEENE